MAKKQKLNLIEELTTHKSDYQTWPLSLTEPKSDYRSREPPIQKSPPPHVYLDTQSHAPYKPNAYVPFNLYFKPKPIVETNPLACFDNKKPTKTTSTREKHSLPTLLSPALPLNDIEDEEYLKIILNYTYTGMYKQFMDEVQRKTSHRPKPPNRVVSDGNDLRYKPVLYPPLPPGWITAARHWDCLQTRHLGDPFRTFWTRRGPEVECSCCCNPIPNMVPKETKEEIEKLITENKLRMAYDITKTGYGGYKPIVAKGVPLSKTPN